MTTGEIRHEPIITPARWRTCTSIFAPCSTAAGRWGRLGLQALAPLLAACDAFGPPGDAEANTTATAADGSICIKDPAETAGPFPADGTNTKAGSTVNVLDKAGVIREDIRGSFDGLTTVAEGVKLDIVITLVDVAKACAPLAGHVIYIWHCDAGGKYSLYELA